MSRIRRLLRRPGNNAIVALSDVTLRIYRGEVFGLVGRNGQGKTTLVKLVAGLLEPTSGSVRIADLDPLSQPAASKGKIGLSTSDERSFYWRMTGMQNLLFFSRLHGLSRDLAVERFERLVDEFELKPIIHRRFHEYSTGNKQRLALVRALLTDPDVLLLDEPTRSLDPIAANKLRQMVLKWVKTSPERTVLVTSHNLAEVEELCDRVGILSQNALVECSTLADLHRNYPCPNVVTLKVRPVPEESSLTLLRERVPGFVCRRSNTDTSGIAFPQENNRSTLDFVLRHLVAAGVEVLECYTERRGLSAIMEEIERNVR